MWDRDALVGSFRFVWAQDALGRRVQRLTYIPGPKTLAQWLEEWRLGAEPASAA